MTTATSMTKNIICLLFASLCTISTHAEDKHRQKVAHVQSKVDSILDALIKTRVDTNYIARPSTNWTLKVRTRGYLKFVSLSGDVADIGKFQSQINTPLKTTLGISANYRGISAALSVNPAKLFGKNSSRNINLSYYNNRYGADFSYSNTDNLSNNVTLGDSQFNLTLKDSYLEQLTASAYYVFNGKRFSYPAVFTHSWIQRRSAGSFLISASFYKGKFESSMDHKTNDPSFEKSITMKHVSIGGGYAYNYVTNKGWLLHMSLIPHIIVWHDYRYTLAKDPTTQLLLEKKIPYKCPGMGGTGRFGATYNWKNYFTGFSSVVQSSYVGIGNQDMSAGNTWMRVEVFWGLRL